jgi:2,3-bisphosphoglycerate-dependent phosphoglycerate mutase
MIKFTFGAEVMTQERVLPYYRNNIKPKLEQGSNVLVVAHGNSLRALVAELDKMTKEEILELNIPTGTPLLYVLTKSLDVVEKKYL